MIKKTILYFILILSFSSKAQNYLPNMITTDTTRKMIVSADYHFTIQSQSIPNYYLNYFLNGGTIANEDKDKVTGGLKNLNNIGAEQIISLRFTDYSSHPFKDSTWGYFINVENQNILGATFGKSLFDLVFYGNGPYAGTKLDLSGLELTQLSFQKIGFGISDIKTGSSFGVSLVKGQNFNYARLSKGDFLTDDSTGNITFDYSADVARSNPDKTKFSAFNGAGVAVDFCWNLKILKDSTLPFFSRWQIKVNNAGFLNWNISSNVYRGDSTISYSGFSVGNILKPTDDLLGSGKNVADTLKLKYERKKYFTLLPVDINIGNLIDSRIGYWIKPLIGFRYKLITGYSPMGYAGCLLRTGKNSSLQITGSYGGWGGFRTGTKWQGKIGKYFNFLIGSSNVDGWLSKNRFGKDLFGGIWFTF